MSTVLSLGLGLLLGACSTAESTPAPASTAAAPANGTANTTPGPAAASPLASLSVIPLPVPSLDPLAPDFPVPEGSELVAAQNDYETVDAYRTATWRGPDDVATTTAFYESLSSGRWTPADAAVTTTIGSTLELLDAEATYDGAALTISPDPPGSLISVRFLSPFGPAPVEIEDPDEVIVFGTLPPSGSEPADLPAWATPEGAEVLATTVVDGVTYAELLVSGDPAAVLDAYGRALDEVGVEREVSSTDEAIVILLPATDPPGSIALARDDAGTRVYLTLP